MKTYDKYKSSGIDWIGDIPEYWERKNLKYIADVVLGKMLTNDQKDGYLLKPYLRAANINWLKVNVSNVKEMWFSPNEIEKLKVKINDLLVSEGGEVGRTCIWQDELEECFIQNSVHKITFFDEFEAKYFLYQFYYFGNVGFFESIVNRISIGHLTGEKLKDVCFITPPLDEQTAIADYLDEKTAQVDSLINNKLRLIELLKEERAAILNQAVTRGINPHAKLKPSGIAWLGDIPEHWEVKRLKYLVSKVGSGITPSGGANVYLEEGIPLLRSQNIYNEGLILEDVAFISEEIDEQMSNSRVKDNDVLLNITGASIGRCCYIPKDFGRGNVNQHVCIIRPIPSAIETKYLHAFLVSGIGQNLIDSCQTGANREGLNFQHIKSFEIPICDVNEQKQIVEFIETATEKIDATIAKIEKEIGFMREYRTALISEVVTGKIKVV